jgi:hypothetical protein
MEFDRYYRHFSHLIANRSTDPIDPLDNGAKVSNRFNKQLIIYLVGGQNTKEKCSISPRPSPAGDRIDESEHVALNAG